MRAGEEAAVCELIDGWGDLVRREIRFHLRDSRLNRVVGESDLFQSTFSQVSMGIQLERFDLQSPADLRGLLVKIAQRQVCAVSRFWTAQRRDIRRQVDLGRDVESTVASEGPSASAVLATHEMSEWVLDRLPERSRQVALWRCQGLSWNEITARLETDVSPEAVRKQFSRAVQNRFSEPG